MKNKKYSTRSQDALKFLAKKYHDSDCPGRLPEHTDPGPQEPWAFLRIDSSTLRSMEQFCREMGRDLPDEAERAILNHLRKEERNQLRRSKSSGNRRRLSKPLVDTLPCASAAVPAALKTLDEPNLDWIRNDAEWGKFFERLQ